ncbi:MAG: PIN domain-containing protein [Tepidiformaceae bacterium]
MPLVVDTNVLVRYLTDDHEGHSRAARAMLMDPGEELIVTAATMSEVVFVLRGSIYGFGRLEISSALFALLNLPSLSFPERTILTAAAHLYRDHHNNWNDCLVAAYAFEHAGGRVASFDKGLDAIPGLTRAAPAAGA